MSHFGYICINIHNFRAFMQLFYVFIQYYAMVYTFVYACFYVFLRSVENKAHILRDFGTFLGILHTAEPCPPPPPIFWAVVFGRITSPLITKKVLTGWGKYDIFRVQILSK